MACHGAARAAAKAGFKKVFIMPDGIEGWEKAGKRIEQG
jgi:rhodanese-related sulfurtransferase